VLLTVGSESYALAVEDVLEVAEVEAPTPVPGSPASVLGVCNLRGNVLPVLDLGALLGGSGERGARRVVVAERGGRRAGLVVSAVTDVGELPEAREPADSPHVSGAAIVDGRLVGMLDLDSLFGAVAGGPR